LLLLHFGQKQKIQWFIVALVNVPVKACCWQCQPRSGLAAADEYKPDDTKEHMYRKPDRKRTPKWNLFLQIFSVKIA